MNKNFENFMENYRGQKIAVAVSGGLDSVCLLYWLKKLNFDITVLHINHKLRDVSDTESDYVKNLAKQLNVNCICFDWMDEKPVAGLESAARDFRYKQMTDYVRNNNLDCLAIAHHADDQIETFLMNLSRGSGVYGLAGIQAVTVKDGVKIIRPLLNVFRTELLEYADKNNIKYFNDEMNEDEKYTRVKIRKNRKCLNDVLGITDSRILLAINNLSRTRDGLESYINKKLENVIKSDYCRISESFLFDEPVDIRLKLLGTILQRLGTGKYQPRLKSLEFAIKSLKSDCKITLADCILRRLKNEILIVPVGQSCSFRKRAYKKQEGKNEY